jgi:hypothetical protein
MSYVGSNTSFKNFRFFLKPCNLAFEGIESSALYFVIRMSSVCGRLRHLYVIILGDGIAKVHIISINGQIHACMKVLRVSRGDDTAHMQWRLLS